MMLLNHLKNINILSLFLCIIIILNNSFFFQKNEIYYAILLIIFLIFLLISTGKKIIINKSYLFLIISCVISVLLNTIDSIFKSEIKLFFFIIFLFLISPLFNFSIINRFRLKLFEYLLKINVIICSLSSFLLITGIHRGYRLDTITGNLRPDFAGLYNHSMLLSPMCCIAILYCSNEIFNKKTKFYLIPIFFCFLSLIISGSRGAILALIISFFYLLLKHGNAIIILKRLMLLIFLTTITIPFWKDKAEYLYSKFERDEKTGDANSRSVKWNQRIDEFTASPIFGIGFSAIDLNGKDNFQKGEAGNIEPGSSILMLLSMTGILGFISFLLILINNIKKSFKIRNRIIYFFYSLIIFYLIHFIFEGYLFTPSNILNILFWLSLFNIEFLNQNYKNENINNSSTL